MILEKGAEFVRVDLHTHTKSDKEFKLENWKDDEDFAIQYVEQLERQKIRVAAITNHNKFEREEYLKIKKEASKKGILVLPGVEVSIAEGKRGMHLLCIFPEELVDIADHETQCTIEKFITLLFPTKRFDSEGNPLTSDGNLREIVDLLENRLQCRYMLIPAHVNNCKGMFKELSFSSIISFINTDWMRKRIVAFQGINEGTRQAFENEAHKVAKKEKIKKQILIPAYIEASDPKDLSSVGSRYTYVKVGELSFDALYFALSQHELRVKKGKLPDEKIPQIKRVEFLTQKGLENVNIQFNPCLNNFIGIRGSGKSTIIEALRYAFELEADDDKAYKDGLLKEHLGSGGKVIIDIEDKIGNSYRIERIFGERAKVYNASGEYCPGLRPFDLMPVVYYGQKDLQKKMKDPKLQMDFIDHYIKDEIAEVQNRISEKKEEIRKLFDEIKRLRGKVKKQDEFKEKLARVEKEIKDFKELGVADKLKLEAAFKKDEIFLGRVKNVLEEEKRRGQQYKSDILDIIGSISFRKSENNQDLFDMLEKAFDAYKKQVLNVLEKLERARNAMFQEFKSIDLEFRKRREGIAEEVAEVKRNINIKELSADDYSKKIEEKGRYTAALKEIEKYENKLREMEKQKEKLLDELEKLWYQLYQIRVAKAREINESQDIIKVEIKYKNDKNSYHNFLKEDIFKGSGIRSDKILALTEKYIDGIALLNGIFNGKDDELDFLSENQLMRIKEWCSESEYALSVYKVPDTIKIFYIDKPLEHLSLGQRASSLLMLLLTMDNSPLIMDQPEDDLDNQMIYKGLVRELLKLKGKRQIIFATHNSNIPVLGDCDQGIVCRNEEGKIKVETGSIDTKFLQKNIVKIMEGGQDAFNRRKEIYEKWML